MTPEILVTENGSVHIGNNQWVSLDQIQEAVNAAMQRTGGGHPTVNYEPYRPPVLELPGWDDAPHQDDSDYDGFGMALRKTV